MELFVEICADCSSCKPCVTTDVANKDKMCIAKNKQKWHSAKVTFPEEPSEPEQPEFKFGNEVEVDGERRLFAGIYRGSFYSLYNPTTGKTETIHKDNVSRPLKNRIKVGQPIVVIDGSIRLYKATIEEKWTSVATATAGNDNWSSFRLPTAKELEEIGHAGKGWLSEG